MNKLLALVGGLAAAVLAGCGSTGTTPVATDLSGPVEPDVAARPTWGGCTEHSLQFTDYTADAPGAKTREAALAPYRTDGDSVVDRPRRAHRNAQVLLVDDGNVIHHALELWHSENGWLVNMVERCAD